MLPKPLKLLAVVFAAGCSVGVVQAAETIDRIIAVVNDGVVLDSEMDRSMKLAEAQLRERNIAMPPAGVLETQVLERLIVTRLQTQRAQEAGIRIDDRELNEVLASVAAQNKLSLQQFIDVVKKDGLDYPSIREQIRDEVLTQRVRQKEVGSRVQVTEQDVDLALANASADDTTEYRLSHILVSVPDGDHRSAGRRACQGRRTAQACPRRRRLCSAGDCQFRWPAGAVGRRSGLAQGLQPADGIRTRGAEAEGRRRCRCHRIRQRLQHRQAHRPARRRREGDDQRDQIATHPADEQSAA